MKSIAQLITLSLFLSISSLAHAQSAVTVKQGNMPIQSITSKRLVVTTPIIYKTFQQKRPNRELNNMAHETQDNCKKEMYIRVEHNNYFVKFCNSQVTRADIEEVLAKQTVSKPHIRLEITLTKGSWDICQFDEMVQSRIGNYAIVHRIISSH